ncbi:MAG: hypothetical protein AAGB46_00235 [Verrucomicrobiota bacterium]
MINFSKHRWLIVTIVHYIALFILSQINHYLSIHNVHLSILGLLIAFSAFLLNFRQGFLSLLPTALYLESLSPLNYGSMLATIVIIFCILIWIRHRIHRESTAIAAGMALIANLAVHAFLTYFVLTQVGFEALNLSLLFLNFLFSSLVIAIFTKLYFACMLETLEFFGIRILEEQRESR